MKSIAWHIFNGIVFLAWVACVVSWAIRGCPIPRWVHIFAGCLLGASITTLLILGANHMLTLKLAISCILVPPAAAYIGWLWMFGPSEARRKE